eukprot:scaffold4812_cov88-Phaeocystis_antarctica.AAC.12
MVLYPPPAPMSRADGLRAFFIRLGKFSELLRSGGLPHATATAETSLGGADGQPEGRGDDPYDGMLRSSRFHGPE